MLLTDAIAAIRTRLGDTGLFLTFSGPGTDAAGQATLHVQDLANVQPGMVVTIGQGLSMEAHLVLATSATTGPGTATLAENLVGAVAANTPIGLALLADSEIQEGLRQAILRYSTYMPLTKRYPITAPNTTPGLLVTAGTDTYTLPADWIAPDRDSFDQAVGLRSDLTQAGGLYSLAYTEDNRFSSVGLGQTSNFGPSSWYGVAPIFGNPADNPNSGILSIGPTVFTFVRSGTPTLVIQPVPTANATYDFFYKAVHTMPATNVASTVPTEDAPMTVAYAVSLLCSAMATRAAKITEHKAASETLSYARAPQFYRELAKDALDEFEKAIRFRPSGFAG